MLGAVPCLSIVDAVFEFVDLSGIEVHRMLRHTTTVLSPTFPEQAELPVLAAAALGVLPVALDMPVFREIAPTGTNF